jgi:hypothetical protein
MGEHIWGLKLTETGCEDVNWIHVTRDRIHWQALVKRQMNLQFPHTVEDFFTI